MSKNMQFFCVFLEKQLFCPKWPKPEKKPFFHYFPPFFLYSGMASGSFFGPQALCDPL